MSQANSPAVDEVLGKQHEIAKLCQQNQVAHLALFGSATQTTFAPTTNDYNFLVEFAINTPYGSASRLFGLKDLCEPKSTIEHLQR